MIDAEEFACLSDFRQLRNKVVYGTPRPSFPPAAVVEGLHRAAAGIYVGKLCPRGGNDPGGRCRADGA
jgi:hypothetical protein